jgi:hypothetical protein
MRALFMMLLGCCGAAQAAPPSFESIFPAGGQVGTQIEVKVAGKGLDKSSPQAWSSDPKVVISSGKKPNLFQLGISADAAPGPRLMRFFTSEGATAPRLIEVGPFEELMETEPNDTLVTAKANPAKMNVTINGVLEKAGDVDTHAFPVEKGQRIILELHGYGIGSAMDPAMRLLNEQGVEIEAGHDTHNLDPRIEHTPTANGTLFVQIFAFSHPPAADVAFKGSAHHVYRLKLTEEPKKTPRLNEPKTIAVPTILSGCIAKAREEDVFSFTAEKGDDLQITVRAQAIRSPLDAILRIEDADGKTLQQADDGAKENLDPALHWKAPKDGEFKFVIADRFHQGSADHLYEFSVKAFAPSLTGTLDTHAYRLEAGKNVEVKLTVKVDGKFTSKIQARAVNLPAGVTAELVDVPLKGGEVKLTLKAATDAAASQAPFAVEIVTNEPPEATQVVLASYVMPFTEPRGDLLIMSDTHPWLTVVEKK